MDKQSKITYVVWTLDVWGHSGSECNEYDCPCMVETGDVDVEDRPKKEHDEEKCQCSYAVNDRWRCGELEVVTDEGATHNVHLRDADGRRDVFTSWSVSDAEMTRQLVRQGYLKDRCLEGSVTFDGDGEDEGMISVNDADNGCPLFQLTFEKAEEVKIEVEEEYWRQDDAGIVIWSSS